MFFINVILVNTSFFTHKIILIFIGEIKSEIGILFMHVQTVEERVDKKLNVKIVELWVVMTV